MSRVKIGVVGAGWWATEHHLPSLLGYDRAELVGIADVKPDKLQKAADFYEIPNRYPSHRQLLEVAGLQGVVISVQHAYHYEVARAALEAGVHVLVEKPMTLSASEAWELVRLADRKGLHLSVGYTFQHTRLAQQAQKLIQSGAIGEIRFISGIFSSMVESYFRGRPEDYRNVFGFPVTPPETDTYRDPSLCGGGQGHTQITHAMGMVFWVTQLRATEVFAFMENFGLEVDLADAVSYRLENQAVGTMGAVGSLRPNQPQDEGFLYFGSDGYIRQDFIRGILQVHYNNGTMEEFPQMTEDEIYPAHAPSRNLVDQILGAAPNLAPGKWAAYTVEFLEAAYQSASTGQSVRIDSLTSNG